MCAGSPCAISGAAAGWTLVDTVGGPAGMSSVTVFAGGPLCLADFTGLLAVRFIAGAASLSAFGCGDLSGGLARVSGGTPVAMVDGGSAEPEKPGGGGFTAGACLATRRCMRHTLYIHQRRCSSTSAKRTSLVPYAGLQYYKSFPPIRKAPLLVLLFRGEHVSLTRIQSSLCGSHFCVC